MPIWGTPDSSGLRHLLDAVATISSDLDLEVVLRRVVETAVELVDARYGALGVLDEGHVGLTEFITVGMDDEVRLAIGELPKGLGLLGSLIRDSRPLRLADLHDHSDSAGFPARHPPMTSFLGVPITVRGVVFGNLYLTDKRMADAFTDSDEELALGLAAAAAVAIDNTRLFEQSRRREATLTAMNEIAGALLSGVGRAESLHLVAHHARALVRADIATIARPDPDGKTLVIDVADGALSEGLHGQRFPTAGTVSGAVLRSGETIVVHDASKDHRVSQPQVGAGDVGPALWVPLVARGLPFGTLSVARSKQGVPFSPSEIDLVRSFATQASVILEHDQARQSLQRVSDLERNEQMARDLHDTVIQRLFAVGMSLQASLGIVVEPVVRDRIARSVDDLDVTIRQIRTVIFGLEGSPAGVAPGLRIRTLELTRESAGLLGFEPGVAFSGAVDTLVPDPIVTEVLATLREALANVARHAQASAVSIALTVDPGELCLEVTDNGVGIDQLGTEPRTGHGLTNMRARAQRLGGGFEARASADGGTRLRWLVSLDGVSHPTP